EPPPAQVGVHRRSQGRRPVQRRLENPRPGPRPAVEPVHRRQRQEEGRAGYEVIRTHCQSQKTEAAASVFSGLGLSLARPEDQAYRLIRTLLPESGTMTRALSFSE